MIAGVATRAGLCAGTTETKNSCARPKIARIAGDGEPGEEGRYEAKNILLSTSAWAGPGSPDREVGGKS